MNKFVTDLIARYPKLSSCQDAINDSINAIIEVVKMDKTIFVAGNGGSAADAEHICGELLKGFLKKRTISVEDRENLLTYGDTGEEIASKLQCGIRAISLLSHMGFNSAFANDVDPSINFAQQLFALGREGDIFLALSTSGNSDNIKKALIVAKAKKIKTILFTGNRKGTCEEFTDIVIAVPEDETYIIQEYHLPIYHTLCMAVEDEFFAV